MILPPADAPVPKTRWQHYVDHKDHSSLAEQRKTLFFGIDFKTQTRIDVPIAALNRGHCHIEGRTGSAKTGGTLMSIMRQAIRGYRDERGAWSKKSPVIIFDFKGDQALFHATRIAAENDARQFRFFSTRSGDGCHFFDPFQIVSLRNLEPVQIADTVIRALGLDYGLTYGGLYFTDNNVALLTEAIELLMRQGGAFTLERIKDSLEMLGRRKSSVDARHIILVFKKLAEYPQINLARLSSAPQQQINMLRALEEGEVIYIFMEMDSEAPSLRQIAGLMLDALVHSAKSIRRAGKEVPFAYVIADEFYHIASRSFGDTLATSRDWGLHFVLANQCRRQLEAHDQTLPEVLRTNTSIRQAYTLDDETTRDEWRALSGEKIDFSRSQLLNALGETSRAYAEVRSWNLPTSLLNTISDTQLASLLYFDTGKAAVDDRRVQLVQGMYPTFPWEYENYRHSPLPAWPELQLKRDQPKATAQGEQRGKGEGKSHSSAVRTDEARQDRMKQCWEKVSREEAAV